MNDATAYEILKRYQGRINAYGALCQMNWETRSGGKAWASELFLAANNAAGIKAGADWKGAVYEKVSWEQRSDGTKYDKRSSFRKYRNFEEFSEDYTKKIGANYPLCVSRADNFCGYFAGLLAGRYGAWATDKEYLPKLCGVAIELAPERFGEMWRNKLVDAFEYALEKDYLSKEQRAAVYALIQAAVSKGTVGTGVTVQEVKGNGHVVCLDAGHGGRDPGTSAGGVAEKDVALQIVKATGSELVKRGYDVRYTRVTDEYVARPERARIANEVKADIYLSIHCNAAAEKANGHEDWIAKRASNAAARLASLIARHWGRLLPATVQRGVKMKDYDVLVLTKMPAVLSETGFLSNAAERGQLVSPEYQGVYAAVYANAIDEYFERV